MDRRMDKRTYRAKKRRIQKLSRRIRKPIRLAWCGLLFIDLILAGVSVIHSVFFPESTVPLWESLLFLTLVNGYFLLGYLLYWRIAFSEEQTVVRRLKEEELELTPEWIRIRRTYKKTETEVTYYYEDLREVITDLKRARIVLSLKDGTVEYLYAYYEDYMGLCTHLSNLLKDYNIPWNGTVIEYQQLLQQSWTLTKERS